MRRLLGKLIFACRWLLFPINVGLLAAFSLYIVAFLRADWRFLQHGVHHSLESLVVFLLGFVDAFMVANLIIMVVQGSHQIFIRRFEIPSKEESPQWLDHVDTGILKVKIAMSITGITLVQILKDFVNIQRVSWETIVHRLIIHVVCLTSALTLAGIWRLTRAEGH